MGRLVSLVVVLAILLGLVSGCAGVGAPGKRPVVNVAVFVSPGGGAPPFVLSLYKAALEVNRTSQDFDVRIVSVAPTMPSPGAYMEKPTGPQQSPNITALEQALGQDPPPDVVLFSGTYEVTGALDKDLLQPLDTYYRSDKNVKPDDYFPGAIEALMDGGRLYALPVSVAPTVLMYDKRVFDEAGVNAPEPNWNWSSFLGYAKQLTKVTGDPQKDRYAINLTGSGPMALFAFIWQNGGELLSKDGKRSLLAEPAAVEAAKFYADLITTYKVTPPPMQPGMSKESVVMARPPNIKPGETPPLWTPTGRVAMQLVNGAGSQMMGYRPYMLGDTERPMRLIELPRGKVPATILDLYAVMGLTTKAANSQVAYRAMVALSNEMQREFPVPARRSLAKNLRQMVPSITDEDARVILNSLEYGRVMPLMGRGNTMQVLYEKLINPIQQNSKPVDEAIKEASDALDEALNQ